MLIKSDEKGGQTNDNHHQQEKLSLFPHTSSCH